MLTWDDMNGIIELLMRIDVCSSADDSGTVSGRSTKRDAAPVSAA